MTPLPTIYGDLVCGPMGAAHPLCCTWAARLSEKRVCVPTANTLEIREGGTVKTWCREDWNSILEITVHPAFLQNPLLFSTDLDKWLHFGFQYKTSGLVEEWNSYAQLGLLLTWRKPMVVSWKIQRRKQTVQTSQLQHKRWGTVTVAYTSSFP